MVAGLDAAVLEASDARALDQWLATHGYQSGDALRRWVAPYVRRRWIVTAFRIAPGGGAAFRTRSMRMSFRASAPFFPYSEPADGPHDPRPFRVSVVAPYRTAARLGDDAWGARVGFAEPVETDRLVRTLSGVLGPDEIPANAWLTVFDEPASVRGTLDVTFRRAPQQTPVAGSLTTPLRPHGSSATGADPLNGLQGL